MALNEEANQEGGINEEQVCCFVHLGSGYRWTELRTGEACSA